MTVHPLEPRPLAGYKFLIIEDEMMQAWRIGDMVAELGGTIGSIAFNYEQGREALTTGGWDCALVDINLNGRPVFPLTALMEREGIPFVYCSAYADRLFEVFPEAPIIDANQPLISKPITVQKLREAVVPLLRR